MNRLTNTDLFWLATLHLHEGDHRVFLALLEAAVEEALREQHRLDVDTGNA